MPSTLLTIALLWATPQTDGRIYYARPQWYLRLLPSIGDSDVIREVAG